MSVAQTKKGMTPTPASQSATNGTDRALTANCKASCPAQLLRYRSRLCLPDRGVHPRHDLLGHQLQ